MDEAMHAKHGAYRGGSYHVKEQLHLIGRELEAQLCERFFQLLWVA